MPMEKATGLVIRASDYSETSRIATIWTREFGKVRGLAKGGRRLKSAFESSLDLLTVCGIVLLRKSSGGLDLLTEAQVCERFPMLREDLSSLYAGYYLAELLDGWTEDHDPHPELYDEALRTLRRFGQPGTVTGSCLAHFELAFWRELGYGPALETCADCGEELSAPGLAFSAAGGGVVCPRCQPRQREKRALSAGCWSALKLLNADGEAWTQVQDAGARSEVRQVLNDYVTYRLGRRPRLLPYVGS